MRYLMKTNFMKKVCLLLALCAVLGIIGVLAGRCVKVEAREACTSVQCFASVKIESGDTLWSLAVEHMGTEYDSVDDYVDEICTVNRIQRDTVIHAGEYLMLPYYETMTSM